MRKVFFYCLMTVILGAAVCGCNSPRGSYCYNTVAGDLSGRSFEKDMLETAYQDRFPVIFIHGLFGAELRSVQEPDQVCWGDFAFGNMLDNSMFYDLALPLSKGAVVKDLIAARLLERSRKSFLGIAGYEENYSEFINMLKAMGYVPEKCALPENCHYSTLFVFCYDWRKSIDENAALLADFIAEKSAYLTERYKVANRQQEVRFDLVGHSMGGLIARYYVQFGRSKLGRKCDPLPRASWYGKKYVRNVVLIGSPLGGYADTLLEMVYGLKLTGMAPRCPAGVLATFPSYFQMLPDAAMQSVEFAESGIVADIFDVALWRKYQWGLLKNSSANRALLQKMYPTLTEEQRRETVLENLAQNLEQAGRFKLLMARPMGIPPEPLRFYSFASAGIATAGKIVINDATGDISVAATVPGDGKVSWASARFAAPVRRNPVVWSGCITLDGSHMGILSNPLLAFNLREILHAGL